MLSVPALHRKFPVRIEDRRLVQFYCRAGRKTGMASRPKRRPRRREGATLLPIARTERSHRWLSGFRFVWEIAKYLGMRGLADREGLPRRLTHRLQPPQMAGCSRGNDLEGAPELRLTDPESKYPVTFVTHSSAKERFTAHVHNNQVRFPPLLA
jgi:hypothetical protein